MTVVVLSGWVLATLLLTLRIAPVLTFAPPFTLIRIPVSVRVLLGLSIAVCLVGNTDGTERFATITAGPLVVAAASELAIGMAFVFALQAAYGALYFMGRVLDIQAGFGLALLIDPTTRTQTPMVGTLFAYTAGLLFFAFDGHHDLLRLWSISLETLPIGGMGVEPNAMAAIGLMGTVFSLALGAAAAAMLVLFLADVAIAFLSRTVPQMNVLLFGLQVKSIVLLLVLAATFGILGPVMLRLFAAALQSVLQLV